MIHTYTVISALGHQVSWHLRRRADSWQLELLDAKADQVLVVKMTLDQVQNLLSAVGTPAEDEPAKT